MLKSKPEGDEVTQARLACVTQDTTASLLSVQTDTSGQRYFIAGKRVTQVYCHMSHVTLVTCQASHSTPASSPSTTPTGWTISQIEMLVHLTNCLPPPVDLL